MAETACEFHRCAGGEHEFCGGGEFGFSCGEVAESELGFKAAEADDESLDIDKEGPVEALPDILGGTHFAARGLVIGERGKSEVGKDEAGKHRLLPVDNVVLILWGLGHGGDYKRFSMWKTRVRRVM